MSVNTVFPIIAHVPSRSTTGNATVRSNRCPASHPRLQAGSKQRLGPAYSKLFSQSSDHDHDSPAPRRLQHTRHVNTKSP